MKIKEVTVSIKRTFSYQSYGVDLTATLNDDDDIKTVTKQLQETASELTIQRMRKDLKQ